MTETNTATESRDSSPSEAGSPLDANTNIHLRLRTILFVGMGFLAGTCFILFSTKWQSGSTANSLWLALGTSLVSTAIIGLLLDLLWSQIRTEAEKRDMKPIFERFDAQAKKLQDLSKALKTLLDRDKAFEALGIQHWSHSRTESLVRFLDYAKEKINSGGVPRDDSATGYVNVVSSSARGLIGYLDREPEEVQREWRDLVKDNAGLFRILLTHPAYAHLRQPAEERSNGDIELEILKSAVYLHCVAKMNDSQLRLYRGSPTVFSIRVGKHILLNPYPYGKMAMETLCLEFESTTDSSYIASFVNKHFNHTWAFFDQDSKQVDGQPLVAGIASFDDILKAFSECTYLNQPKRLRLERSQVKELDHFIRNQSIQNCLQNQPADPFTTYVENNGMRCSDDPILTNGYYQMPPAGDAAEPK
jgi:hypothetical protein